MTTKAFSYFSVILVVIALLASMYLVFNTDSLSTTEAKKQTKQFVAGAHCVAPESSIASQANTEINFVGCGGFF